MQVAFSVVKLKRQKLKITGGVRHEDLLGISNLISLMAVSLASFETFVEIMQKCNSLGLIYIEKY